MDYSKLTKQDIVDQVWTRLNDGTGRAMSEGGGCSYLSNDGLKCAVGIFLPDDHVVQSFSNYVSNLIYSKRDKWSGQPWFDFLVDHEELLSDMQFIHDTSSHWNEKIFNSLGKEKFENFCKKKNLNFPGA